MRIAEPSLLLLLNLLAPNIVMTIVICRNQVTRATPAKRAR